MTNQMSYYALPADDNFTYERAGHFLEEFGGPEGARKITKEEADAINAHIDTLFPKVASVASRLPQPGAEPYADLQQILDRLDAQSKLLAEHAALHDEHTATAVANAERFDQQAQAILDVKAKTAKAIAEALNGLGEKGS